MNQSLTIEGYKIGIRSDSIFQFSDFLLENEYSNGHITRYEAGVLSNFISPFKNNEK